MSRLALDAAFYTGDYPFVISFDTSGFSDEDSDRAKLLKARARIASGDSGSVLAEYASSKDPLSRALVAYASHVSGDAKAVETAAEIAETDAGAEALHLAAVVLTRDLRYADALRALDRNEGHSLDIMLLKTYILLVLNKVEQAKSVVAHARTWANDHVAFNLAEAWTSLRNHKDPDAAQKAFYIFEENNSFHPSPRSSLGEAVSQLELRRFPEAVESIKPAIEAGSEDALATEAALAAIQNSASSNNYLSADLKAKSELFDQVAAKYAVST